MTSSLRTTRFRALLTGLSLGVTALAATGCAATVTPDSQEPSPAVQSHSQEQPNIMMLLLDDLGYSDLAAYGGEAETPNIDALAQESAQFTNFHAEPLCAPTRAALLTGQAPHQVGLGSMEGITPPGVSVTTPGYKGSLEGEFTSISTVLDEAGYDTYHVGKWHLGEEAGQTPQDLGFDRNFTLYDAGASYYPDGHRLFDRGEDEGPADTVIHERDGEVVDSLPDDFFATRSYTDEMIQLVDQSVESDQPFFGYLAYTAPHDPLHVENKDLIDHYLQRYLGTYNYEEHRQERIQQMVELGLIDEGVDTRWPDQTPDWNSLTPEKQKDMAYRMAVYAAVIHEADEQVGRVIDHLKETGEYDNTLIVVASDNGASTGSYEGYARRSVDGWHQKAYPLIGEVESYGHQGSFPSIGQPNAQVSSGPYFQAKRTLFEGGTRVPALMKPPAGEDGGQHRKVDTFAHVTDLYPTFAEFAGADISSIPDLLGDSIKPLLDGATEAIGDEEFGAERFGHRAYWSGDWKLIFAPKNAGGTGDYALYNLAEDPGETRDVSADHPEIVADLSEKWDRYAQDNGVISVTFEAVNEVPPAGK